MPRHSCIQSDKSETLTMFANADCCVPPTLHYLCDDRVVAIKKQEKATDFE